MSKMQALVLEAAWRLVKRDMPIPTPAKNEILIQTKAAVICTSDINDIKHNPFGIRYPMIMGHEGAGIVASVGPGVTGFKPGDAVAAHPVMPCGSCESCKRGIGHLCDNMSHFGIDKGGVFAEYFIARADRVRKIPAGIDFATAALMEPVCVCIESLKRANVTGDTLIIGDGPFGVITSIVFGGMYPKNRLIMAGSHDFRLERTIADVKINRNKCGALTDEILKYAPRGVGSVVLCVGNGDALRTAVDVLRPRGTVSIFSAIQGEVSVDWFRIHVKELNLCGSCNDMDYLDEAMEILAKTSVGDVVTHRLPFDEYEKAFDIAANHKNEALKVCMEL